MRQLEENCSLQCNFYVDRRECVIRGMDVSEWFPVKVGWRQGCVMSPCLFNAYMDGEGGWANFQLGKELELLRANGVRFEINHQLFSDYTALVANSEQLCRLVSEFGRVLRERENSRVEVGKSKDLRCSRYVNVGRFEVRLNGGPLM